MRKSLEAIALIAMALLVWITYDALTGPNRLPDRIPTHFDAAGNANGWGSPAALILLPIVAIGLYFAMSITALFPGVFHYPVRATRLNMPRLQEISLSMISWLKAELSVFFAVLQWAIVRAARSGQGSLFALLVPALLVVVFSTIGWHFFSMIRAARAGNGPIPPSAKPIE